MDDNICGNVQLLVYRIPSANHSAMRKLQKQLTEVYRKHGTLKSEFFQLGSQEPFMGFVNLGRVAGAGASDEVWVELDSYKDQAHREKVVERVNQDESAGKLFGQLMALLSEGYQVIMGDFGRLDM